MFPNAGMEPKYVNTKKHSVPIAMCPIDLEHICIQNSISFRFLF